MECGFLEVQEDREAAEGRTIQIAFARYHSNSSQPLSDPLVFLPGGPGAGALQRLATLYPQIIAPFLDKRDFIVFDPRGTGFSQPSLACNEIAIVYLEDIVGNIPDGDRITRYTSAFETCQSRLQGSGINLAAYTSAENAADVHDLAAALGYEQVNLFGVSYGTRLGQIIMRDYPELVRSAIFDSVLPLEVKDYTESVAQAKLALRTFFEVCANDPACQSAYPDLETTFNALVVQFNAQPIKPEIRHPITGLSVEVEISGTGLISSLMWNLRSAAFIPVLPQAIYNLQAGDPSALSYYLSLPVSAYQNISLGVLASTSCQEQVFATTFSELDEALTNDPEMAAYGRAMTYGGAEALFTICELWLGGAAEQVETAPLESALPTLILAGQLDPTTPPVYGQQLAGNLPHSFFFTFPMQGHAPSFTSYDPCPLEIMAAFLHDPFSTPADTCLAEMEKVSFALPFSPGEPIVFSNFIAPEGGFTGQYPQGWSEAGLGFYNRAATYFDVTQVGMQNVAVSIPEWLAFLNTEFQGIGFDQLPEAAGEFQTTALTWQLYRTWFHENPVDLAFAEKDGMTYMVVFLSHRTEREALYEAVFLPMLQALIPAR